MYSFLNVSGLSVVLSAVAVSVPSPLSTTVTVTVLVASASFVTPSTVPDSVTLYVYVPGSVNSNGPNVVVGADLLILPVIVSAAGASPTAATVTSKLQSAGPSSPFSSSSFVTGKLTVVGSAPYVFSNLAGVLSVDGVAVSVPSPLSTTSTVTVLVVTGSFVTPSTVPVSVTVYVYVPGFVNSNGPNVTESVSWSTVPLMDAAEGDPSPAVTSIV